MHFPGALTLHTFHYDYDMSHVLLLVRFKDGNLVDIDDVSGGNSGSIYVLSGLTKADEGQYTCRAVSLGGKKFSRLAKVVVKGKFV